MMIKVIVWLVALSKAITSIVIIIMYLLLVKRLKESQETVRKSKSSDASDTLLILQLVVTTASNIICWFPANGIYLAAMFLSTYPTDLIIQTTVTGLPINSKINPSIIITNSLRKY